MTHRKGFKYSIAARPNGRFLYTVWRKDVNSRIAEPLWHGTAKTQAQAERVVTGWIDDRRPRRAGGASTRRGTR